MSLRTAIKALLGTGWHVQGDAFVDAMTLDTDGTVEANKPIVADANKDITGLRNATITGNLVIGATTISETDLQSIDGVIATPAELNRAADVSTRVVSVVASPLTADLATHEGKIVALNLATGIAVTLPAAAGSGARYQFVIGTANSSTNNYTIATAPTTDIFQGSIFAGTDNGAGAGLTWPAASNSNKITLGGTSHATGGSVGDTIIVEDIAAGVWAVRGQITQGGTEATPYSHV